MKQTAATIILFYLWFMQGLCAGYDIKTTAIIDQPGIEVLGDYKGSWYVIGFDKPGTVNKPPQYKILKYNSDFHSAKTSETYPSFGEKTIYLTAAFVNNKISLFYARCDKRADETNLADTREGHRQMSAIVRQDYDPNTLEPAGEPKEIFAEVDDRFGASGMDVASSADGSKTAIIIKCYYRQQKFKVILTDNSTGQEYVKVYDQKDLKQYFSFQNIAVSNSGTLLIQAKVRQELVVYSSTAKDKSQAHYYFFSVDKSMGDLKQLILTSPQGKNQYMADPVICALNNGDFLIANSYYSNDKSTTVKGISVGRYTAELSPSGKKDISFDPSVLQQAAEFNNAKKESGLPYLNITQLLPLDGGNFMLIAEHQHTIDKNDKNTPKSEERHYLLAYRFDDNMGMKDYHFIPKKQVSSTVDYAFSAKACRKGNDVYLYYNGDWEEDGEHDMNLQCTKLPANGGEPVTQKVVHTSDDFFTSLQNIYPRNNGQVLFAEEKLVDYDDISKEVKLLEVTVK